MINSREGTDTSKYSQVTTLQVGQNLKQQSEPHLIIDEGKRMIIIIGSRRIRIAIGENVLRESSKFAQFLKCLSTKPTQLNCLLYLNSEAVLHCFKWMLGSFHGYKIQRYSRKNTFLTYEICVAASKLSLTNLLTESVHELEQCFTQLSAIETYRFWHDVVSQELKVASINVNVSQD